MVEFWFSGLGYFGLQLAFVAFMICRFALVGGCCYTGLWLWLTGFGLSRGGPMYGC